MIADAPVLDDGQDVQPEGGEAAVVLGRFEDDGVSLATDRRGNGLAVLGQFADCLVGGHHAVDGPPQVDGGRPGVAQDVRGATQRGPSRIRSGARVR